MSDEYQVPFTARYGLVTLLREGESDDFREALLAVLEIAVRKYPTRWEDVASEFARCVRVPLSLTVEYSERERSSLAWLKEQMGDVLLPYGVVFNFIERVATVVLSPIIEAWNDVETEWPQRWFQCEMNVLFQECGMPYEMTQGEIRWQRSVGVMRAHSRWEPMSTDRRLDEARTVWMKGDQFLNRQPEPDLQNAMKESAVAIERAVYALFPTTKPGKEFAKVLHHLVSNRIIRRGTKIAFDGFWRDANDAKDARHGVAEGWVVQRRDAEFALIMSGNLIRYLWDVEQELNADTCVPDF